MKFIITIFLFYSFITVKAQTSQDAKPFIIGETRILKSTILNEDRILNIYLPEGFDKSKSYPVIYLLDGSANEDFLHIVGLVQF